VAARLSEVTKDALWAGIAAAVPGATVGDVGHAIEASVHAAGSYGIVAGYTGHGIGSAMHMDPNVHNTGSPGRGRELERGMAIAIEPMITLGGRGSIELDDGWTVVTKDGSLAAHWEHTVAITAAGPWVLTAVDGGGLLTGDPLA
jgi:methionyl aminopeptidase